MCRFFFLFSRSNTGFVVFQLLKCVVFREFPNITDRSEVFHPLPAKKRELYVVSVFPFGLLFIQCVTTHWFLAAAPIGSSSIPRLWLFLFFCSSGHIPSPKYSPFAVLLCFYFVGFLCGFRLVLVFCILAYPQKPFVGLLWLICFYSSAEALLCARCLLIFFCEAGLMLYRLACLFSSHDPLGLPSISLWGQTRLRI